MQRMWIDGRWTAGDNPATEEIIDEVPRAGSRDADLAVGLDAFREPKHVHWDHLEKGL